MGNTDSTAPQGLDQNLLNKHQTCISFAFRRRLTHISLAKFYTQIYSYSILRFDINLSKDARIFQFAKRFIFITNVTRSFNTSLCQYNHHSVTTITGRHSALSVCQTPSKRRADGQTDGETDAGNRIWCILSMVAIILMNFLIIDQTSCIY